MLKSRVELLKGLLSKEGVPSHSEEPLKNIKSGMGELSQIVGNPLFKAEITLQITTFFGEWNGANYVQIAPAALPAFVQFPFPVYIFGLTDFYGGFSACRRLFLSSAWDINQGSQFGIFNYNYYFRVVGTAIPPFLMPLLEDGDLVMCISQMGWSGIPPNLYSVFIRVHCNNIAYGTFLHSFASDLIYVNNMRLFVDPAGINQYANPLIFGYQTLFGKLRSDSVSPRMYQLPSEPQNAIVDIPVKYPVDKNLMIVIPMDIFCQRLDLTLFVEKIEPLTLRKI